MLRSMSGKGNCYDNAVAESFFSPLKNEIIHHVLSRAGKLTRNQKRASLSEVTRKQVQPVSLHTR
jgi:transposase InsO family protein